MGHLNILKTINLTRIDRDQFLFSLMTPVSEDCILGLPFNLNIISSFHIIIFVDCIAKYSGNRSALHVTKSKRVRILRV